MSECAYNEEGKESYLIFLWREFAVSSFLSKGLGLSRDTCKPFRACVPDYRRDEAARCSDSDRNIGLFIPVVRSECTNLR
jgi:hypothetical protein